MEEPPDIMGQHQKVATLQRNIAVHDKLCHHASKHAHMLRTGESADEDDEEDLFGDNAEEPQIYPFNMRLVDEEDQKAKKQALVNLSDFATLMKDGRRLGVLKPAN